MPIYHFEIADHVLLRDPEGTELASPGEARIEAIRFAGAYLADHPELLGDGRRFEVMVSDDSGGRIVTIAIEALEGV